MLHIESLYYDSVRNQRAIATELVSANRSTPERGFRADGPAFFAKIVAKLCGRATERTAGRAVSPHFFVGFRARLGPA
jgi:hypothetical protein